MIEMYNNIRNLINRPNVDIRGLRNLLSKVQGEEEQNLHPITKDITERTIYYIVEINYDDDEVTPVSFCMLMTWPLPACM